MDNQAKIPPTPIYLLSTQERFQLMFHGPASHPDAELLADIQRLRSPAYAGLSRTHRDALEAHEFEARRRGLKI